MIPLPLDTRERRSQISSRIHFLTSMPIGRGFRLTRWLVFFSTTLGQMSVIVLNQ